MNNLLLSGQTPQENIIPYKSYSSATRNTMPTSAGLNTLLASSGRKGAPPWGQLIPLQRRVRVICARTQSNGATLRPTHSPPKASESYLCQDTEQWRVTLRPTHSPPKASESYLCQDTEQWRHPEANSFRSKGEWELSVPGHRAMAPIRN